MSPARRGRVLESGEKGCEDGGRSLSAGEPDEAASEASGEDGHYIHPHRRSVTDKQVAVW